jgi:fatty-acyl-CoA synthase
VRRIVAGVVRVPKDLGVLARSGLLAPARPDVLARAALALLRDGFTPAAAYGMAGARYPSRLAVTDDHGAWGFAAMERRVAGVAAGLSDAGIGPRTRVAVLCRNSGSFVEAVAALSALGADILLLNTGLAAPALASVLAEQGATAVVVDDDLLPLLPAAPRVPLRFVAGAGDAGGPPSGVPPQLDDLRSLDELAATSPRSGLRLPARPASRYVLLTSGTTGRPKGAVRSSRGGADAFLGLLANVPVRVGDVALLAAPLFHAWGFANLALGLALSWTLVLRRRFDAAGALASIARHRVRVMVAVPVMLQRILELPADERRRHDLSSLEIVAVSGAPLTGDLARRWAAEFGDVVYNVYGSTEAGWATIATPADLRVSPGTAGRAPRGTRVRIADAEGRPLPAGRTGRILVGSGLTLDTAGLGPAMPTAGLDPAMSTGGLGPAMSTAGLGPDMAGLVATGDVGHLDAAGRLFVEGREDDMIVSGGENVYPREIEDLLATHPDVADVLVEGVADPEFGQRLRATVVPRPGIEVDPAALKDFVRQHLATYKVPREVELVPEIPRNETGKVVRRRSD